MYANFGEKKQYENILSGKNPEKVKYQFWVTYFNDNVLNFIFFHPLFYSILNQILNERYP